MAKSQIEFFEALKHHFGEEGAKLLAEVYPPSELVTKDFFKAEMAEFRAEMADLKAEMRGWMLAFFVPLWIGVYLSLAAIVVSIFVGR
jgi:hypothetical protein